ncbi:hypothetical protein GCM10022379_11440 [Micromonospora maritima]
MGTASSDTPPSSDTAVDLPCSCYPRTVTVGTDNRPATRADLATRRGPGARRATGRAGPGRATIAAAALGRNGRKAGHGCATG